MQNYVTLLLVLRNKRYNLYFLIGLVGITLISCGGGRAINAEKLIQPFQFHDEMSLDLKIFHQSRDSSTLFLKLSTEGLLYRDTPKNVSTAYVTVTIHTVPLTENTPGDSLQFTIFDEDNYKAVKDLLSEVQLPLKEGGRYALNIKLHDLNKDTFQSKKVVVDKSNPNTTQNFLLLHNNLPVFGDCVVAGKKYQIRVSGPQTITGRYYHRSFAMPAPPFSPYEPPLFNYEADSVFTWNNDSTYTFVAPEDGFINFLKDPAQKEGLTLFTVNAEFPEVRTVASMLQPFKYLVSTKEFEQVRVAADKKTALEEFWKQWGGSEERARRCIEAYYQRVETSNRLFSSYVPGWKTDRGMIYIIFGTPNSVYKTKYVESWVYGEENNPLSLTFNFVKVINPFTENDYRLSRQELYKPVWYRAVESWRAGRPT